MSHEAMVLELEQRRKEAAECRYQATLVEHERHCLRVRLTEQLVGVPDDRGKPHSQTSAKEWVSIDPRISELVERVAHLQREAERLDAEAASLDFRLRQLCDSKATPLGV